MKPSPALKTATGAITANNIAALRKVLNAEPELAEDPRLINTAALWSRPEAVRMLLNAGADPDGQVISHEYYRPLHRVIEHRGLPATPDRLEVIKILLEAGASLEKRGKWMQLVPLAVAGMEGDKEAVALLLPHHAPVDIHLAAILADAKKVAAFLKKKPALASARDVNNMTVLHYAALSGMTGKTEQAELRHIANLLLDAGGDGNAAETIGPYPAIPVLHFAAWGNLAVAEVLLSRGCDPNLGFGNCLWSKPGPMAELFLSHGADVSGKEASGQPLLNSRIHWNLPSIALWLIKNGADPNATDKAGNTPLHEAARRGINPTVVESLLAAGAKKTAKNKSGETPLFLAKAKGRTTLINLLSTPINRIEPVT